MEVKNKVSSLFGDLCRHEQLGDFERGLKVCNKILQLTPDDEDAFTGKVVCLMLTGQFEEVVRLTKKNANLSKGLEFEIAYCLYRLNRADEAYTHVVKAVELESGHREQELTCQIYYKLDQFKEAVDRYAHIFREYEDDEYQEERQTNICAAASFLQENNEFEQHLSDDNYEVCYNKALKNARRENLLETDSLLKRCEVLMKESLDEEGTDEEIAAEMANIKALQAYCFQKRGRVDEAHKIYLDLLKNKHEDPSLNIVASNNIAVINKDQNVFDSKKKLKVATNDAAMQKMPSEQKQLILLNNATFNYITNQYDQAYKQSQNIEKMWPELLMSANILGILSLSKMNTKVDAVDLLLKYKPKCEEEHLNIKLTCVQILLTQGNKLRACEILESMGNYRYKPAIIGALITLYLSQGKEDVALKVYEESIDWYKKNEKIDMDLTGFFTQAATFHIRSGRPEVAVQSLEQLLSCMDKPDSKTVAQLITAYAQFDESKVVELETQLGSIGQFERDIDMDTLESVSWLTKKSTTSSTTAKESSPGTPVQKRKRRTKKRRGKLPKDYDASAVPDPERWLPKYERTGFRKKRDRRMKDIIKGSQGTTSGQSDQFDYSKMPTTEDDSPTVDPSPAQKGAPRQKRPVQKKRTKRR